MTLTARDLAQLRATWLHRIHRPQRLHGEWFALDRNPLPVRGVCFICAEARRRAP